MKKQLLAYLLIFFMFFSCNNQQDEMAELNSFLKANYEFNTRTLNKYKGDYYQIINEQPERKVELLNKLDSKYKLLISVIDNAISNKDINLKHITSEYHEILNEIPKIVNHRKDYLLPEFDLLNKKEINSKEFQLNNMKNRLVIAMAYAFEFAGRRTVSDDGLYIIKVDSIFSRKTKNGIKLTLTSKYGQDIRENRHIVISRIQFNGIEKKVNYKLHENYAFADIVLDSLQKGNYQLEGVLRYHDRDGKIDIPFNKKFVME